MLLPFGNGSGRSVHLIHIRDPHHSHSLLSTCTAQNTHPPSIQKCYCMAQSEKSLQSKQKHPEQHFLHNVGKGKMWKQFSPYFSYVNFHTKFQVLDTTTLPVFHNTRDRKEITVKDYKLILSLLNVIWYFSQLSNSTARYLTERKLNCIWKKFYDY